ncbi:MAG: 30S ribosomal protein S5 [archaeon]
MKEKARGNRPNAGRKADGRKRKEKDREEREKEFAIERKAKEIEGWVPKTELGRKVRANEINSLDEAFDNGYRIMESQVVDSLVKDLDEKLVNFKKTAKVRRSGRMFSFRSTVIVGDRHSYIGVGIAKDKERFPSIRKATKKAKLNLIRVRKGCGSWECGCGTEHSVPFMVEGKCGSVRVKLMPAPRGTGLVIGDNAKDVFRFVGITDVWSETKGATDTTLNFVLAAIDALRQTTSMRLGEGSERHVRHKKGEFAEETGEKRGKREKNKKENEAEKAEEESAVEMPKEE